MEKSETSVKSKNWSLVSKPKTPPIESYMVHAKAKLWLDGQLGSSTGFTLSCHKSGNGQEKKGPPRSRKS